MLLNILLWAILHSKGLTGSKSQKVPMLRNLGLEYGRRGRKGKALNEVREEVKIRSSRGLQTFSVKDPRGNYFRL